jgi:hypothetical protein
MGREIEIVGVTVCHYFFWEIKRNTHRHAGPGIPEDKPESEYFFNIFSFVHTLNTLGCGSFFLTRSLLISTQYDGLPLPVPAILFSGIPSQVSLRGCFV